MKQPIALHFGSCLRALRLHAGLSQVEFGERCGFYQTYLSRIENGNANPTLNAMEVMANALGLSIFEFFREIENRATQGPAEGLESSIKSGGTPPNQMEGITNRSADIAEEGDQFP